MFTKDRLLKFRQILSIISIIIGISVPVFCYIMIPKMDILYQPLSVFGITEQTKYLWFVFIQLLAMNLYFLNIKRSNNIVLNVLNFASSISLSLLGIIDMNVHFYHTLFAILFFVFYTCFIFWYGFGQIKKSIKTALKSMILAVFILLSAYISLGVLSLGYGIFEIIFILSLVYWNKSVD